MWFKNRARKGCGVCPRRRSHDNSLESAFEEEKYKIVSNPHRKSFELGLFNGNIIEVIRNSCNQRNIIIGVNDSRYIISKDIARHIKVQLVEA
ncbi:MAG TPA: FeoA family protein [Candidatus Cloacimonadota bacterium]|jgi:Fe2+ transport system protein FeoA|nr:FeoA family protein [Candidatus Cloacimonadales bacterium]HPK40470.1 FeoA family protein [Candidatus Cloacimonadota bacterium]HPY96554.1 FeoA family protein [Candidatus Cloacimonadota bacterium]HQB41202.1 FeoA family protein [Candidatus Cloacimonadota bacterium]